MEQAVAAAAIAQRSWPSSAAPMAEEAEEEEEEEEPEVEEAAGEGRRRSVRARTPPGARCSHASRKKAARGAKW